MKESKGICLIGDIVIDVRLKTNSSPIKLRLGGITHAARALWALGMPYSVAYFAPSYLDEEICKFLGHHGCQEFYKLGDITGAPNVFLIEEAKETGSQGYDFLLRDALKINYADDAIEKVAAAGYSDYLCISGNYDLVKIVNRLNNRIHIDVANNIKKMDDLNGIKRKVYTLFLSTSSDLFHELYKNEFEKFAEQFESLSDTIVLKENRGGSRSYNMIEKEIFTASTQPRKIEHSVGVGDVYDAVMVANQDNSDYTQRMALASWIAAEYAVTCFPDDFKLAVTRILQSPIAELTAMEGVRVPWECRETVNIYIAAPDFDHIDPTYIDLISEALRYHNFTPRRPIKENGQMEAQAGKARRQELVSKDIEMLDECSLVVGVLIGNDPGTLIELGYAKAKGVPVFVYDPYHIANNCMLTELPDLVSSDPEEIITAVFGAVSKHINERK